MRIIYTDLQRRRLKRTKKGWKQLCNARVLKTTITVAMIIYRIMRLVYELHKKVSG